MKCAVCDKGVEQGVTVHRMNVVGQPGLWACNEHKDHFDGRIPDQVKGIVKMIEGARDVKTNGDD